VELGTIFDPVTIVLMTVGIVGALGAIRSIEVTQAKAKTVDLLQQLASEKLNDLTTISDPSQYGSSGDFSDRGYPNTTWSLDVEPTSVTNLDEVTVTATKGGESEALATEMFVQSQTGTSTTSSSTSTGGSG
jgi:hypothetical protein